jgi:hypothetical protein
MQQRQMQQQAQQQHRGQSAHSALGAHGGFGDGFDFNSGSLLGNFGSDTDLTKMGLGGRGEDDGPPGMGKPLSQFNYLGGNNY